MTNPPPPWGEDIKLVGKKIKWGRREGEGKGEGLIFLKEGEGKGKASFPSLGKWKGKKWKGSGREGLIFFPANLNHAFS